MRLFQVAVDTPLDSPFSAILSVHGLHFTVCAPSSRGALRIHALINNFGINFVLIKLTLTCSVVFVSSFEGPCDRKLFWGQFLGCKEICISPRLLLDVPPFLGLHLHSGDYTYTLKLFSNSFPPKHTYTSNYECNRGAPKGSAIASRGKLELQYPLDPLYTPRPMAPPFSLVSPRIWGVQQSIAIPIARADARTWARQLWGKQSKSKKVLEKEKAPLHTKGLPNQTLLCSNYCQ